MTHYAWVSDAVAPDHALTPYSGVLLHFPRRASPMFPDGHRAWDVVRDRISDGRYRGAQIELDAHACVMDKADLVALVDELCALDGRRDQPEFEARIETDWRALRDYVAALPDGSYLVVVAAL